MHPGAEFQDHLIDAQVEALIGDQLRQLGCSCDWQRTRFTLDDQCARAVREWFFRLFSDGKIYRGKRLVNWDPKFQTAISDLEVETREVKGQFWKLRYPLEDGSGFIEVATTRPETMLGDTAVAVSTVPPAGAVTVNVGVASARTSSSTSSVRAVLSWTKRIG